MGATSCLSKESVWWKDLTMVCGIGIQGNWFDCRFQWCVGDEKCIKFWDDRWVDDQALKDKFPRLHSISQNKDSLVGDIVEWDDSRTSRYIMWNLSWRREKFEWEKHLEEQMLAMISNVKWDVRKEDKLVWVGEDHQDYTVKSGYSILNGESLLQTSKILKLVWSLNVAPSALVGAWRLLLDRMPTRFNLARRGVQLGNL